MASNTFQISTCDNLSHFWRATLLIPFPSWLPLYILFVIIKKSWQVGRTSCLWPFFTWLNQILIRLKDFTKKWIIFKIQKSVLPCFCGPSCGISWKLIDSNLHFISFLQLTATQNVILLFFTVNCNNVLFSLWFLDSLISSCFFTT